jgi:hypothetical protein
MADDKSYSAFFAEIRERESSDRYNFSSKAGYLGAYQFAEITMKNLGYYKGDSTGTQDWIGGWTGKDGVTSKSKLLTTPALQDKVFDKMLQLYWGYANQKNYHMPEHIGETIDGLEITPSLIVAGSHLLGIGKMRDWLDGVRELTSGQKTYFTGLSGFELPFVEGSGSDTDDDSTPALNTASAVKSYVIDEFTDFLAKGGKIDLEPVDANTKKTGDQAFIFNGAEVNGGDGHIFYKENTKAGVTYVEVDHGASEFRFTLKGVHLGLTESDFNL